MKVSKAQAQANRSLVVDTASRLFRERGFDGVGVADLMASAGFTHGGFYKHFGSKADLMAEATACGLAQTLALSEGVDARTFIDHYLSRAHRDGRDTGCTMAALGADIARQPGPVRQAFAEGIDTLVAALMPTGEQGQHVERGTGSPAADATQARARILNVMAHAVGALVLSRACPDDSPLADEILAVCQEALLAALQQTPALTPSPPSSGAG